MCMGKGPMANEVYLMDFGRAEVYTETMTNIHRLAETGAEANTAVMDKHKRENGFQVS